MEYRKIRIRAAVAVLVSSAWLLPDCVYAQGDTDTGEVAALGGVTLGAGTQPAVIATAGVGFSKYGMGLFSIGFTPMGHSTIQPWPAAATVDRSLLYDFGADFHVRIPVGERWAPYGIAGAGLLWNTIRQNAGGVVTHFDQFNGALHTGAGLRYYINKSWGLRPEVKVIVSKQIYTQIMFGFFYVTPAGWP